MAPQQPHATTSTQPQSQGVATGFVLALVVCVCLSLVAMAGYFQYRLHQAEAAMLISAVEVTTQPAEGIVINTNQGEAEARRILARNDAQLWSMLLTFVCWASLIIACATSVGVYLTILGRHSAPLRALTQSIKNMVHGDMRTSIWGMERRDAIGELARTIDLARYQFNQLPDMSVLSDKGPIRLRFEGNTKSLFDSIMESVGKDSEMVRTQAATLTDTISKQQEMVALLSSRVEAVLHNVEKRGLDGDKQVRDILQNMLGSADALKHAQEHAADQLNRVLPFMQERAQGMAEITQIAGKQIAQSLQSITLSERGLKGSADMSEQAIQKLSSTADDLSSRLFGAVNLLQASGKVLSETNETMQSRLSETIAKLDQGIAAAVPAVPDAAPQFEQASNDFSARIGESIQALESVQNRMEEKLAQSAQSVMEQMRAEQDRLAALVEKVEKLAAVPAPAPQLDPQPAFDTSFVATLQADIRASVEASAKNMDELRQQISTLAATTSAAGTEPSKPDTFAEQMRDHWFQMAGQIEASRASLAEAIAKQVGVGGDGHTAVQPMIEQQTRILSELVATMGVLDAHMQDLRAQVTGMVNRRAG